MSATRAIRLSDIKHCILCSKETSAKEGAVSCCQFQLCESDDGVLKLNDYAMKAMMKFCYVCGGAMIVDEDCMYCESCRDTMKFDAPCSSVVVSVEEVLHCVLCAKRLSTTGITNKPRCVKACNFRLTASDNQTVTTCLKEYARLGKVAYCYTCGSGTKSDDGYYVMCSKEDCNSCRLPMRADAPVNEMQVKKTAASTEKQDQETQTFAIPTVPLAQKVSNAYMRISKDSDPMCVYKIATFEVKRDHQSKIEMVEIGPKCLDRSVPHKVMMILGATGSGKTTLINAIANYIFDVQWNDSFRFVLIPECENQTQSQTQFITAYTFHKIEGSNTTFTLTLIDTPGFGDTQGIDKDKKLIEQITIFFNSGIDHLDAIAVTAKAPDVRLTHTQRYIFDSVLSVFGKDVASNIFLMATFADGGVPRVFEAVKEARFPSEIKKFKFNNSALYATNNDPMSKMFWDMGVASLESFFIEFLNVKSRSLKLTQKVLEERKHLETCIQGLQEKITEGISKINVLREEKKMLKEFKESVHSSRNFTKKILVTKQRVIVLKTGEFVTNCLVCNRTCHYPCTITIDDEKHKCAAMKPQGDKDNSVCAICPGKCSWRKHVNAPKRLEFYQEVETHTYADIKKRYEQAIEGKCTKEKMVKKITEEKHEIEKQVYAHIQEARKCLENLDEIALKPNPLSEVQYIELLIQAEKLTPKLGWEERVYQYERAKKVAQMMAQIKNNDYETFMKESGFSPDELSDEEDTPDTAAKKKKCIIS